MSDVNKAASQRWVGKKQREVKCLVGGCVAEHCQDLDVVDGN